MYVIAVETSCDETGVAVVHNGKIIREVVASQVKVHSRYGGVIPELAARLHTQNLPVVFNELLPYVNLKRITHVAYTASPGLVNCLQVGKLAANALAQVLKVPLLPINHLVGHVFAAALNNTITYPALALVVSGGHTQLMSFKSPVSYKTLGETLDDAAGEAYDKVARELGFSYPGGSALEKLAQKGKATIKFMQVHKRKDLHFTFSGLKSVVCQYVRRCKAKNIKFNAADVAASFQKTLVELLITPTREALRQQKYQTLVLAGGVAANNVVRQAVMALHPNVLIPSKKHCTDNAAMVARAAEVTQG